MTQVAIANSSSVAQRTARGLTGDEFPFVQDGFRDGEHIRHWMHERFVEKLQYSKTPWVLIAGGLDERHRKVHKAYRYSDACQVTKGQLIYLFRALS